FAELRITSDDLLASREAVVGKVIAATSRYGQVDQAPKRPGRRFHTCAGVRRQEIEDEKRIRFFCPGEETFVIFFDETHRAVDRQCAIGAKQLCRLSQK